MENDKAEFEARAKQAFNEINEVTKKYNVRLVPQLHITEQGIEPTIGCADVPQKSIIETAHIDLPKP